jgi:hypothetical protein
MTWRHHCRSQTFATDISDKSSHLVMTGELLADVTDMPIGVMLTGRGCAGLDPWSAGFVAGFVAGFGTGFAAGPG